MFKFFKPAMKTGKIMEMDIVKMLPTEIVAKIFSHLDPREINSEVQYVCKGWYEFFNNPASEEIFWAPLYIALFDRPPEAAQRIEDEQILLSEKYEGEYARPPIWRSWRMSLHIRLFVENFFRGSAVGGSTKRHEEKWHGYWQLGNSIAEDLNTAGAPAYTAKTGLGHCLQEHIRTKLSKVEANNILFSACVEAFVSSRCCDPTQVRTLDDFSYAYFTYAASRMKEEKTPTGVFSVTNLMLHGTRIARKAGARINDTNIAGLLSGVQQYANYSNSRKIKMDPTILRTTLEMFDLYDRVTQQTKMSVLVLAADIAETYSTICEDWDTSEHWFFRAVNIYQRVDDEYIRMHRVGFLHHMHAFQRTGKTAKQHLLTALEIYTRLRDLGDEDTVTLGNTADVYTELLHITADDTEAMGYFELSVDLFIRAIDLMPGECVHNNFGWLYLEASRRSFDDGYVEMAIEEFRNSLRLNPHYYNSQSNICLALIENARKQRSLEPLKEAARTLQTIILDNNTDYKSTFFTGIAYLEQYRISLLNNGESDGTLLDKAFEYCMSSLELNKGNLLCTFTVAHIAALKGDTKLCERYIRRFNKLSGATNRNGDIALTLDMILENACDLSFHAHSFSWFAAKKYSN